MLYSADQIKQFEELFKKKMYRVEDIDYQAWLLYKWDSVGSEDEAFNHVLKKRKPANLVPKKTRQKSAPEGSARYHMNDPAWDDEFQRRMANESKNKRGVKKKTTVPASTVTSGALEEESVVSSSVPSVASLPENDNNSTSISTRSDTVSGTNVDDDTDLDLPDISDPIVSNAGMRSTLSSDVNSRKRRGNNSNLSNSRIKRVKVTKTTEKSSALVPSAPRFPLESGISPLIDFNDDDDNYNNNSDNNNGNVMKGAKRVIPVPSTFLDDMDMDEELNSLVPVSRQQASDTLSNNNNIDNSSRRKLRTRAPSSAATSDVSKPQASKSQVPVNPGLEDQTEQVVIITKKSKLSKLSSKSSKSASTSTSSGVTDLSVPISMVNDVTDGNEIKDKIVKKVNLNPKMKLKPKMNAKDKKKMS